MSEITASEQIRLDIIKKVNYDTAAAKLAIDWGRRQLSEV